MEQEIINQEIKDLCKAHPLYSQENSSDPVVIAHFFLSGMDWWITEGSEQEDGKWLFFGYANLGFGGEWGYVSQEELEDTFNVPIVINGIQGSVPVHIERDEYWTEKKFSEIKRD